MRFSGILAFVRTFCTGFLYSGLVACILSCQFCYAEGLRVSVVSPQIRAPYSRVFDDMAAGIGNSFSGELSRILLEEDSTLERLEERIARQKPDALICLGSTTLNRVKTLNLEIPLIAGGVVKNGELVAGISMIPDGASVMRVLLELRPSVKQVHTLTYPGFPEEMLAEARAYLAARGVELLESHAESVQEAAVAYREMAGTIADGDALWILPGARYLDNAVFSLLLEVAWQKELTVFSSNPSHVGRGALFSIYPDNSKLGESLGKLANEMLNGKQREVAFEPLRDLQVGINSRTANHLGVDLNRDSVASSRLTVFSP